MSQQFTITCPVSAERVDENAVRITAALLILFIIPAILFNNVLLTVLLAGDFSLRAFNRGKGSPLRALAHYLIRAFRVRSKKTDAAPKRFAAAVGVFFTATIAILQSGEYYLAAKLTGLVLVSCALAEAAAGICLGCILYTVVVLPLKRK